MGQYTLGGHYSSIVLPGLAAAAAAGAGRLIRWRRRVWPLGATAGRLALWLALAAGCLVAAGAMPHYLGANPGKHGRRGQLQRLTAPIGPGDSVCAQDTLTSQLALRRNIWCFLPGAVAIHQPDWIVLDMQVEVPYPFENRDSFISAVDAIPAGGQYVRVADDDGLVLLRRGDGGGPIQKAH